jgi:hypothetical protein
MTSEWVTARDLAARFERRNLQKLRSRLARCGVPCRRAGPKGGRVLWQLDAALEALRLRRDRLEA